MVTEDNTDLVRPWNRIYYFKKCSKEIRETLGCQGHYGWAEFDGVYLNLYDKSYITYDVLPKSDDGSEELYFDLSGIKYDFVLNLHQKTIEFSSIETGEVDLIMEKVPKSEIKYE